MKLISPYISLNLPSQKALYFGIRGCSGADRILSIAPDGSLFPCSQLICCMEKYGFPDDGEYENAILETPPLPPEKPQGKRILEQFYAGLGEKKHVPTGEGRKRELSVE